MEDALKKLLYTGVGLAATATEKIQQTVQELVDKGTMPAEDGKKVVDDFVKNTTDKREEFESKLKNAFESVVSKFDLPKKAEFDALNKKIKDLEKKLSKYEKEGKKTTSKAKSKVTVK